MVWHSLSLYFVASKKASPVKAKKTGAKTSSGDKGDTVNTILAYLYEMHEMGTEDVKVENVLKETGYARTDSNGYRNAVNKATKDMGFVEKTGKTMRLTEKGMEHMTANAPKVAKPTTNKEVEDAFKARIVKFSKGKAPEKTINTIWQLLSDGKTHERDEILHVCGYKRPDSTGYRETMKHMRKLGVVETPTLASFKFAEKTVFPFDK